MSLSKLSTLFIVSVTITSFETTPAQNREENNDISFYCKYRLRYQENSGYKTKSFYFITDIKTIPGEERCLNLNFSELNDKMHEQVKYNFPELVTQTGWHNLDGGLERISVISNESKNEVDRLRRNDISGIRDEIKSDDKINTFVFDLDDFDCD